MVVSFSITDIIGIIDLSRKIWVAFDEGPRGARDDFATLYREYEEFVRTFQSLRSFFENQSECEYNFAALQETLERLETLLARYGRLKGSASFGRVFDTVRYPFRRSEIENIRQHLTRHHESLMLYCAKQNHKVIVQARDAAMDTNERTEAIYNLVQHMRAELQALLAESPRRSIVSPDPRVDPLVEPQDDTGQAATDNFSSLPSAMIPSTPDESTPQSETIESADVVALPDVSTLTHMNSAEIEEALHRLCRQDSGFYEPTIGSSQGPSRTTTFEQFLNPNNFNSPITSPILRPRSRPSSDYSPTSTSPRPGYVQPAQSPNISRNSAVIEHSESSAGPVQEASMSNDEPRPEPVWELFCHNVVMKSRDDTQVFRCRFCQGKQQRMTLKFRRRNNGNIKLRLGCSKCDRKVLEHECHLNMTLVPYTFYTGNDNDDEWAIFFNSCSGHQIPGKNVSAQPKYLFGKKNDYIKFQELIYGMDYIDTWNVKEFFASDGNQWSDETVRLFINNINGLIIVFSFVLMSNGGKGYFEASRAWFEEKVKRKGKTCKLRLKERKELPTTFPMLTRRNSVNTSAGTSVQTMDSTGSTSSTMSVAASCVSFDGPPAHTHTHSKGRRKSSGSNKQINWDWIELEFLSDKECESFVQAWTKNWSQET